jgi:hypothetical protein
MSTKALGLATTLLVLLPWAAAAGPFEGSAQGAITAQAPVPAGVQLEITASGAANRMGPFSRVEVLTLDPVTNTFSGAVTFTDSNGDTLHGTVAGAFVSPGAATGSYEWTSGTGRFEHPLGTARFVVTSTDGVHFSVQFKGSLSLIRPAS